MFVVTGASGFVGTHLVRALSAQGSSVLAVARRPIPAPPNGKALQIGDYADLVPPGRDCVLVDVADTRDLAAAQAAGEAHVEAARERARLLYARDWAFVVVASSAAVYGDAQIHAHREDEAVSPASVYARAKHAAENAALAQGGAALRLANLYGPGMAANNVLSDILAQCHTAGPIKIRDGGPVRDYLWVADAVAAFMRVATARAGGIWNVGTGRGISARSLARMLATRFGKPDREIVETAPQSTVSHLVLDCAALAAKLSWTARTSLDDGLSQLAADLK
ncbi:MAG: NAD(P)-dependent oxidoreductase [Magnetospirillum sp.]|nr:NAD(P)-dependent oxidoreductase [Magnetospirillum sp.]